MRRARVETLLGAVLCISAVRCGGPADSGAATFTVRDSAGVQLVENGRVGLWGEAVQELEEVRHIGVVEGNPMLEFSQIWGITVAPDGTLFVSNSVTSSVRVFTPDGSFVRELGRPSEGPGEYQSTTTWLAGDSLVIADWGEKPRYGVYDPDGNLVTFRSAVRPGGPPVMPVATTPRGWIAVILGIAPGGYYSSSPVLWRYDTATGEATDTFHVLPRNASAHEGGGGLFEPLRPHEFDGTGNLFVTLGGPYRVDVFDPSDRHVRRISRAIDPVPIRDEDIAELKALISEYYNTKTDTDPDERSRRRDRALASIDQKRANNPRPYLPPIGRMLVAHDGAFWVERTDLQSPARREFENMYADDIYRETRWDLFDAEGRFLGSVDLSPRFTPLALRGLEVTGVLRDELDVEFVVTYRVVR